MKTMSNAYIQTTTTSAQSWLDMDYIKSLVSVIIPTYNRALLLQEAIQSVAEQTYRPIECIIVDDGSIDSTKLLVQEWVRKSESGLTFRYIHQVNAGAPAARNKGTRASRGEFIQYLDSDDLLYKSKITEQVSYLISHHDCDCIFGDWDSGEPGNCGTIKASKNDDLIAQMLTGQCIHTLSLLMRRNAVLKTGPWDERMKRYQEVDFHLSAVMAGAKFEYSSLKCGLWRYHTQDRIHNKTGLKEIMAFYQKWEATLEASGLFTRQMALNISNWYIYLFSQYQKEAHETKVIFLKEVIRLNPNIAFYRNLKMRVLVQIVGIENALSIWVKQFRKMSEANAGSKAQ